MEGPTQAVEPSTAAPETAESTTQAAEKPLTPVDRLQAYLQRKSPAKEEASAEPEATDGEQTAGAEQTEEPEQKPEPAKTEPEEPEKPKPQARELVEAAKLKADKAKLQAELLELRKKHEAESKSFAELKSKAKANPLRAIEELFGEPLPEIMKRAAKGEFDDRLAQLPEDVREKLAYVEQLKREKEELEAKQKAEAEERERAEQETQLRAENLKRVKAYVIGKADEYTLINAIPGADEQVLDIAMESLKRGEQPDLDDIATKLEAATIENFERFLGNEAFAKALLGKSETIAKRLASLVTKKPEPKGSPLSEQGKSPPEEGPRTLSNSVVQEVQTRTGSSARSDDEAARIARLRSWQRANRG